MTYHVIAPNDLTPRSYSSVAVFLNGSSKKQNTQQNMMNSIRITNSFSMEISDLSYQSKIPSTPTFRQHDLECVWPNTFTTLLIAYFLQFWSEVIGIS